MSNEPVSDVIPIHTLKAYLNATIMLGDEKLMTLSCNICREDVCKTCVHCSMFSEVVSCNVTRGMCGHYFHTHCIEPWIKRGNSTCPFCSENWKEDQVITF